MLRMKQRLQNVMISLYTFSKESSTLPRNVFKDVCNKTGPCANSALMSVNIKADKTFNQLSLLRSQSEENNSYNS